MKHWTRLLMRTRLSLEKENMIWNMTGSFFYAFASMVLSFLVLRIAGAKKQGTLLFQYLFCSFSHLAAHHGRVYCLSAEYRELEPQARQFTKGGGW